MDKVARMLRPSEIYVNITDLLFRHDSDAQTKRGHGYLLSPVSNGVSFSETGSVHVFVDQLVAGYRAAHASQ